MRASLGKQLHKYAQTGYALGISDLLSDPRCNVNYRNHMGESALIMAVYKNEIEVVELLLTCPTININIQDDELSTPLIVLCQAESCPVGMLQLFLARDELDINMVNDQGWSALMYAAFFHHVGAVRLLLQCLTVDVNIQDGDGNMPLITVMHCTDLYGNSANVYDIILSRKDIQVDLPNKDGWTALIWTIQEGDIQCTKKLINKGANVPRAITILKKTNSYCSNSKRWPTDYDYVTDKMMEVLNNWKRYLPEWTMWNHYCFPQEFKEIVVAWLLVVAKQRYIRKCVNKDMRRYIVQFIAAAYKFG